MPPIKQLETIGELAVIVGERVAPEATETALNLLSVTKGKAAAAVESALPDSLKAMVHVGPNDGSIAIHTSIDQEIIRARQFESESRSAYAKAGTGAHPQLRDTQKTDTLVIGGGFTGLSIAEKLAASGVKTMLVDAGRIGEGTSQFAGGMITRAGDPSLVELQEAYGERTLGLYAKGMVKAHDTVMQRAARMGKDVDFKPSESHQLSYDHSAADEWMRGEHAAIAPYDNNIRIVTGAKARAIFTPAEAVMTFRNEGQLNPLKYAKKLGQDANHPIFENSPIIGLQVSRPGGPVTALTTNGGRIEANRVVFATGTGGNLFRDLDHCVEGAQCFAGIAETPSEVRLLGNAFDTDGAKLVNGTIRNRGTDEAYNYFRKPADSLVVPNTEGKHLLLFGGADKMLPEVQATRTAADMDAQLQTLFPGSKMLHQWTGLLEESKDGMPIIAQHSEFPQIYGVRGVGGSGIDSSQFIADQMPKVLNGGDSVLSSTRFKK